MKPICLKYQQLLLYLLWARSELFTSGSCNLFATYLVSYSQINGTTKKKKYFFYEKNLTLVPIQMELCNEYFYGVVIIYR